MADPIRLIDDPSLEAYTIADAGFTGLADGITGSGKTLALRKLIQHVGSENVVVVATDPRLAPLDGLNVKVLKCWIEPSVSEPAEMKAAATDAWNRMQAFHRNLRAAVNNPKVVVPKYIIHDNLTNTGDILAAMIAPLSGQLSQPQWGELARRALDLVTFYRGLQIRGLVRIINITSGREKDEYGRSVPVLFVGMGGKLAPTHLPRKIDYMFHVEATYDPNNPLAGPDGMARTFQTCAKDGVIAKGAPQLPTPTMKADWLEVCRLVLGEENLIPGRN